MGLLVGTNILLHAADSASPLHGEARATLAQGVPHGESLLLTWGIVYEFLRVSTHPRVFPTPLTCDEAWGFVGALLERPAWAVLVETPVHAETLSECARQVPRLAGNLLHDFHTAVLMREHGVSEVLTEDADFRAFPWVRPRRLSARS